MPDTSALHFPIPFSIGANLPWFHYGIDFGANAWQPAGGLAHTAGRQDRARELPRVFATLGAAGITEVRWFLFCDGRAGIRYDRHGLPAGLDPPFFEDVDTAIAASRGPGIRIMFVLFDFLWCDPARVMRGVQMGGRSRLLFERQARHRLLTSVVAPMLDRYRDEPQIAAWDVMNEPEWIRTASASDVLAVAAELVSLVRSIARQPVTLGSAGMRWRDRYHQLALDFAQVHWYDGLVQQPSLATPVSTLGFERPVLLGEFPTRDSVHVPSEIVTLARAAGYCGAYYWSALSRDACSGLAFGDQGPLTIDYPSSSSAFTPVRMP